MWKFILVVCLCGFSYCAGANVQTVRIAGYIVDHPEVCQEVAQERANALTPPPSLRSTPRGYVQQ